MGKTIHTLAYMVTADTRNFTTGMVLTRKEMNLAKEVIESATPATDKYANSLSVLQSLHAKGALNARELAHATNRLNEEFAVEAEVVNEAVPLNKMLGASLAAINPITLALAAGVIGWTAAMKAASMATSIATSNIKDQIKKIDDLIAAANTIGVTARSFQAMGHGAELADIEISEMSKGVESMLGNVSKAAGGSAKLVKVFDMLGLDAKELKSLRPEDQMAAITSAIGGMADVADRVRAATAIFGDADFLRLNTAQLAHAQQLLAELGGGLSDLDEQAFNDFDDAVKDMNLALDVSWKKLTMAVIPALGDAAEAVTEMLIALNQNSAFKATLDEITSKLQIAVSIARGMPDAINSWLPSLDAAKRAFESANPKLGLLGRAVGMAVGAAGGDDLSREHARGSKLDEELAAKNAAAAKAAEDQKRLAKEQADAAKELAPAYEAAAAAIAHMRAAGNDLVSNLQQQIATFGMSSRQADLFKAAQQGASIAALALAAALQAQLNKMEEQQKQKKSMTDAVLAAQKRDEDRIKQDQLDLFRDAQDAKDSLMTPQEVADSEIARFKKMLDAGMIDKKDFDALSEKSNKKAKGDDKGRPQEFRNPAAVRGSQEAIAMIAKARMGEQDKQTQMVDLLRIISEKVGGDPIEMPVVTSLHHVG